MSTLRNVVDTTRSLLEDESQEFSSDDYLIPKINLAYRQAVSYLRSAGTSPFSERVVDLPNQQAGITDFIAATQPGQPWDGLHDPIQLQVKLAGQPDEEYRNVPIVARLPNVSPLSQLQPGAVYQGASIGAAEWRGNQLFVTPFAFPFDARLRGVWRPGALVGLDDVILVHDDMDIHLPYSTCVLVGMARGGPGGAQWVTTYGPLAEETLDGIANDLQKQGQGTINKFARPKRRRRMW